MPTAATRRTFSEQALHYFVRQHENVRRQPIAGPAAWRGSDLATQTTWIERLSPQEIGEVETAWRAAAERGLAIETLTREEFRLPTLGARIQGWAREIGQGRGFILVRSLPVKDWGEQGSALAYWGLGCHLGIPGGQNPDEELLGHVTDYREEASNPNVRRYRTAGHIAYHCDLADVVGLLCLENSSRGGASRIVSSVSVYNEVLARRPDLVGRLYEPFLLDTRDEGRPGGVPYVPVPPCRWDGSSLRTFYHSDYFRSVVRHAEVAPFTEQERELLDLYEAVANDPALYLDMQFEPGDIQLISNHTILHSRTAYEDSPGRRRHLLRLWLSLRD